MAAGGQWKGRYQIIRPQHFLLQTQTRETKTIIFRYDDRHEAAKPPPPPFPSSKNISIENAPADCYSPTDLFWVENALHLVTWQRWTIPGGNAATLRAARVADPPPNAPASGRPHHPAPPFLLPSRKGSGRIFFCFSSFYTREGVFWGGK